MRLNLLRFSREPLKIFVGQKFFIKLNFIEPVHIFNVNAETLSRLDIVELRKDAEVKKYFNCISSLTVSEMSTA